MLKVSARLDLKIWADLPSCCRAPSVGTRTSCNLHWRFRNRFGGSKKKGYIRQQKPSCDRSMAHSKETSSQRSLGDAAGLPVFAKEDTTAKAISPYNAKETNQEEASWAKKLCQWRHNAQRLPATLAWILPVLMLGPHYNTSRQGSKPNVLSSFTRSRSQVDEKSRQTTTVQVALAGPGTLVTLVVATSCILFLERKLCSANSKRSPKAPLDFSV